MDFVDTFLNIDVIQRVMPMLWRGVGNTLALAFVILTLGAIVGVLVCLVRLYAPRPLRWLAIAYIDIFRAIPILVLLVLIYYALPFMGIRFGPFVSASLALGLVFSSFTAEVFRAGIQAIPKGQIEAADALGLSFPVIILRVILPQAFRIAIPAPLTANPSPLIAAALMYLIFLLPAVRLVSYLENRYRPH